MLVVCKGVTMIIVCKGVNFTPLNTTIMYVKV